MINHYKIGVKALFTITVVFCNYFSIDRLPGGMKGKVRIKKEGRLSPPLLRVKTQVTITPCVS